MIASKDEHLAQAAQTMFRMSADDLIRKRCLDRQEYYQDLRSYERAIEESERKRELDRQEHEQAIDRLSKTLQEQSAQIEYLLAEIAQLKTMNPPVKQS